MSIQLKLESLTDRITEFCDFPSAKKSSFKALDRFVSRFPKKLFSHRSGREKEKEMDGNGDVVPVNIYNVVKTIRNDRIL